MTEVAFAVAERLARAGSPSPGPEARQLVAHVLGVEPSALLRIDADGRILRIAENTEPQSLKIISSGGLAKGVLEVIAGTAQKYGIVPGDRVAHPLFKPR